MTHEYKVLFLNILNFEQIVRHKVAQCMICSLSYYLEILQS